MQASTYVVKGGAGFEVQNRRGLYSFRRIEKGALTLSNIDLRVRDKVPGFGPLRSGSVAMGAELARARGGVDSLVRSSVKARSVRALASGTFVVILFYFE